MSRCRVIYSGRKGFATLASVLGQVPQIHIKGYAMKNKLAPYIECAVQSPDTANLPHLQVSFAARWAMLLLGQSFPRSKSATQLLRICQKNDPNNIHYALLAACYSQENVQNAVIAPQLRSCSTPRDIVSKI